MRTQDNHLWYQPARQSQPSLLSTGIAPGGALASCTVSLSPGRSYPWSELFRSSKVERRASQSLFGAQWKDRHRTEFWEAIAFGAFGVCGLAAIALAFVRILA